MIECPECQETFKGAKCSCGYVPRVTVSYLAQRNDRPEVALTQKSQEWLLAVKIHTPGMTREQKRAANIAYINRLKLSTPTAQAEPRAWANAIKSDYLDGVCLDPIQIAMASEALNETWADRKCEARRAAA